MIEAANLTKSYGSHKAISDVSFKIADGEVVGLLGLNGAGKSTILKILGCFLLPSGGTARISGFSVEEQPHEIRKLIGYLPDTPPLYDEMTVDAYLRYVAKLKDVRSGEIDRSVAEVIRYTNMVEVAGVRLGDLSHGYRQRVGIAQALVHKPKVLILDEPINGLDPVQIVEMRDLITSLRGKHTVILSSHILSEITRTCDRILIVDQGKVVAEGAEEALQRSAAGAMVLHCDVQNAVSGLIDKVKGLAGVTEVDKQSLADGGARLVIATEGDIRAQVAEVVVGAGAGLLALTRGEAGLEGLFMKLVRSSEARG